MNTSALRLLELDSHFEIHGVEAVVTRPAPDETPIETRVIWPTPDTSEFPSGLGVRRAEAVLIAVIRRDDVPTLPRGTEIVAARTDGGTASTFVVEGFDRTEADLWRAIVTEVRTT